MVGHILMQRSANASVFAAAPPHTTLHASPTMGFRAKHPAHNPHVGFPLVQVGAICLSVSLAAVDDEKWGLLAVEPIDTSWGSTKLFIHEKLAA